MFHHIKHHLVDVQHHDHHERVSHHGHHERVSHHGHHPRVSHHGGHHHDRQSSHYSRHSSPPPESYSFFSPPAPGPSLPPVVYTVPYQGPAVEERKPAQAIDLPVSKAPPGGPSDYGAYEFFPSVSKQPPNISPPPFNPTVISSSLYPETYNNQGLLPEEKQSNFLKEKTELLALITCACRTTTTQDKKAALDKIFQATSKVKLITASQIETVFKNLLWIVLQRQNDCFLFYPLHTTTSGEAVRDMLNTPKCSNLRTVLNIPITDNTKGIRYRDLRKYVGAENGHSNRLFHRCNYDETLKIAQAPLVDQNKFILQKRYRR